MTDEDKRALFIYETLDNLKAFWLAQKGSMDLADVMNVVLDTDEFQFADQDFADKLGFELEQLDA